MAPENQNIETDENAEVDRLMTPSWLSGLIAVVCGLIVTGGVILAFSFNTSQVQQQLMSWENTSSPALTVPGGTPSGSNVNSLQNTWPLIAFWAVIGMVVYFIVEAGVRTLHDAAVFKNELDYVNVRRDELLKNSVRALLFRIFSMVVWLIFIEIFFKRIIPYSITAANASSSDLKSLDAALYALLSFSIIVVSMHVHTIFLRLAVRRPRVFSSV
jgi:hypothetical protein